jgi:hypothetical protein
MISIQGYICSSEPHGAYFWNTQNVRKNTSNHIWTDLLLFEKIKKLYGKLPPKIVILMDNTSTENKNKIYLQWCMLLVILGIFKEVQWIFLPVGHTHWENDQSFSKLSVALKNNLDGFKSMDDFYKVCIKIT